MALIKFGPGIVDARGSVGGVTFSKNSTSHYMRARVKPVNPKTARQDVVRSAMAALSVIWSQTLTAAQRTAWNLYASNVSMTNKLGEAIYLSGQNHFVRCNMLPKSFAFAIGTQGPVVFEIPAQDPTLAITATEAAQTISMTFDINMDWCGEANAYINIFQGIPQNAQRNFFGGPWRYIGSLEGDAVNPMVSPFVFPVSYAIAELQHQWIYCSIIRADRRLSQKFRADAFVAA